MSDTHTKYMYAFKIARSRQFNLPVRTILSLRQVHINNGRQQTAKVESRLLTENNNGMKSRTVVDGPFRNFENVNY